MRKPKGKLVALLAGAVAGPLLTLAALYWKDAYCRLFLDPRLVGRWTSRTGARFVIKFDRVGNMRTDLVLPSEIRREVQEFKVATHATYRIDGDSIIVTSPENGEQVMTYRIERDSLTVGAGSHHSTFRRVPDDS